MFKIADRNRVRDTVLQWAEADPHITAGAVVGSLALQDGDRWSDLDLTFGVADDSSLYEVLENWTGRVITDFDAVQLFDLRSVPSIYRVFLLPGNLQFDLSFTPASKFGAIGPKFKLLFGSAVEKPHTQPPTARELFGYAVHHALRARFCIERGRFWQAEYWISSLRDHALSLACRRRGLPAQHGRGFDDLPGEVHNTFRDSFASELNRDELMRAFTVALDGLLGETEEVSSLAAKVAPQLRELTLDWESKPVIVAARDG